MKKIYKSPTIETTEYSFTGVICDGPSPIGGDKTSSDSGNSFGGG